MLGDPLFVLPEKVIHLRDLMQYEEASPDDGRARWSVTFAIQIAAQHCDPQYGLLQSRALLWRVLGIVRMAIQCLPFDGLQQYFARQIRVVSCQQGCVQDAPAYDGKQSGGPHEPLKAAELARLDTTATF